MLMRRIISANFLGILLLAFAYVEAGDVDVAIAQGSISIASRFFEENEGLTPEVDVDDEARRIPEPIDEYGTTLLHRYARQQRGAHHIRVMVLVENYFCDIRDYFGNTPLTEALDAGILENVVCLLRLGADINQCNALSSSNQRVNQFVSLFRGAKDLEFSLDWSINLALRILNIEA